MTNETTTQTEIEAAFEAMGRLLDRQSEHQSDIASASNEFETYWAGSAAASISHDYDKGRTKVIRK
jgi:hypothetical protein